MRQFPSPRASWHSPFASAGIRSGQTGTDDFTQAAEAIYADDATHGFLHADLTFVVDASSFTAQALTACALKHGLELNLVIGKTEAVV